MKPNRESARETLIGAHLMLLFTPEVCGDRDPLEVLEAVLPWIDVVQVRPKSVSAPATSHAPCAARETYDWCVRVLDVVAGSRTRRPLVLVDDRVDVAMALREKGCAGVHLGQDDCPVLAARALLGSNPLIGLSTHELAQVERARELPVDYLGFGPIHATPTKGYTSGLGARECERARAASAHPVFAIGGIDRGNVAELASVGRAAVGAAILRADDPARAARELRFALALGRS